MTGPASSATLDGMATSDVSATLREMWTTRPHRRRSDAKIAGVAAAVARRYDLDPLLVRIGFVVAAFYGIGILLYLLGWLVLPADRRDRPSADDKIRRGPGGALRPVAFVVLCIAAVGTAGSLIGGSPRILLGAAVVGLLLYLLHRHRGGMAGGGTASGGTATGGTTSGGTASGGTASGGTASGGTQRGGTVPAPAVAAPATPDAAEPPTEPVPGRATPPQWDPLGAAPFAWDLPEPGPPAQPTSHPRPRSRLTLATLGLALLVGGVSGPLLLAGGDLRELRTVFGLVLGVLGLGLVVGAFRHSGRGLILPAIPLIILTYGLTAAPLGRYHDVGDRSWTPLSTAELQPAYQLSAGHATLDLRQLDLRQLPLAGADRVGTRLQLGAGDATVLLPPGLDVTVHCHSGLGTVDCLGQSADGQRPDRRVSDMGSGGPGGGTLDLDVSVGLGNVEVRRG